MRRFTVAAFVLIFLAACGGKQSVVPNALPAISKLPPSESISRAAGGLKVAPAKLTLYGKGTSSVAAVVVSESKYTGTFTEKNTCSKVATLAPASGKGPSLTVTLTGVGKGKCTVTFSDAKGHKAALAVTDKNGGRLETQLLVPIALPHDKRGHRRFGPKFISPSTQAMTVKIAGNGVDIEEVTGLTALSPGCALTLQGLQCTFGQSLPSCPNGTNCYKATFTTYDAYDASTNTIPSGAAPLSISVQPFTIADNQTNSVTFNFSGIPAQIAVVPGTALVAQSGNVYDLIGPGAHNMYAEALDADNNVISGIGGPQYAVAVSGGLAATVTQPPAGSPRFTVTPPAMLMSSSTLGTLTVTATYGNGQTDGCAVAGAVCSSAVALDMQSLLAIGGGYSIELYAAEKGTGPLTTITSGLQREGTSDIEFDAHGTLYAAVTAVGVDEYALGSTIPARTILLPNDIVTKMALDASGNLFVLDVSQNKLFEYAPGTTTPSLTLNVASSSGYPYLLAVDSSDDVWVGYVNFDGYYAVKPTGGVNFYAHGSTTPVALSGLTAPVGLAVDTVTKTLYVSDQTNYTPAQPYQCNDSTPCKVWAYTFGNWGSPASLATAAYAGDLAVLDESYNDGSYGTLTVKGVFQDNADGSKFAFYRTNQPLPVTTSAFTAGLDPGTTQAIAVDELGNMFVAAPLIGSVYGYRFSSINDGGTSEDVTPFVTMTNGISNPAHLAIVP